MRGYSRVVCKRHIRPREAQQVHLAPCLDMVRWQRGTTVQISYEHVDILVDLDRDSATVVFFRLHISHNVMPLIVATGRIAFHRAVVRLQAMRARDEPHLDETKWLVVQVVFAVLNTASSRHELHISRCQGLSSTHGVFMRQISGDDVRYNLHVGVRVGAEASFRLHEVVV